MLKWDAMRRVVEQRMPNATEEERQAILDRFLKAVQQQDRPKMIPFSQLGRRSRRKLGKLAA